MEDLYALAFGQGLEVDLVEVWEGFLLVGFFEDLDDVGFFDEVGHADEELPAPLVAGDEEGFGVVFEGFGVVYPPEAFEFADDEVEFHFFVVLFDGIGGGVEGLGTGGEEVTVWVALAFDAEVVAWGDEEDGWGGGGGVECFVCFCEVCFFHGYKVRWRE